LLKQSLRLTGLVFCAAALGVALPQPVLSAPTAWDIANTGQPYRDVSFTTTEGTWMSVDVSPDGKTLVFDLLGDIYSVPATGGDAKLIQGGPAMQRTPNFSSDGRHLLFISDASGAENVWMCDPDGTNAHQITHETQNLIMAAVWGPDDDTVVTDFIDGRYPRRFASDIRIFDVSGGSRVVVPTPANKRDVAEPALTRDGRYLYYTERLAHSFGIYIDGTHINYAIKRRDMQTGAVDEVASGWGSAMTPQVSPDGKRLAFVRRVLDKTVLFNEEVATSAQRAVYDDLDRDLQASYEAQANYYPHFGWFPDNRHVAIWGKGKLYNVDMDSGAAVEIPFRVQATHRITEPLRIQHDMAPAKVTVRAIRNLAPAPDEKTLVFSGVGYLWRKTLPAGSPERDFYVWSDTDQKYLGTRVIFVDTESSNWTWDPVAKAHYWHRFFSHQPDLNFDNPEVLNAVLQIMRFWLDMGVDGFRLDAIPYLVEREGTNNENLRETHEVIKQLRAAIDAHYKNRFLLAEANQWPEDVREYFGDGDECHMAYHFPLMPRIYMSIAQEDRFPITEIMQQTPDIPDSCQWAIFLRNHDELTLEMVTSKERDYMYLTYASDVRARINLGIRRRLSPLMENDHDRIKLMNSLLLSMPGSPILYYGDEIGMGDNVFIGDRNGVRTPMQWSPDRNAGFSRADPQRLYLPPIMDPIYGYQSTNVEAQIRDPSSLLSWTKRMLAVRKTSQAFGRGLRRFLKPGNRKILAYLREYGDDSILCVANLSRSAQPVELNLGAKPDRGSVAADKGLGHLHAALGAVEVVAELGERVGHVVLLVSRSRMGTRYPPRC